MLFMHVGKNEKMIDNITRSFYWNKFPNENCTTVFE